VSTRHADATVGQDAKAAIAEQRQSRQNLLGVEILRELGGLMATTIVAGPVFGALGIDQALPQPDGGDASVVFIASK
jgi:hypothetical protein